MTFTYDARGRQISRESDGGAERVTFAYDSAAGVTVTPAVGGPETFLANDAGGVELIRDGAGRETKYDYDANYQLAKIATPTGLTYRFTFNAAGSMTGSTDPAGRTVTFQYDKAFQNLTSYTDAKGVTTKHKFDAKGNLTATTYADRSTEGFSYDSLGNLAGSVNRRGRAIDLDDARGGSKQSFADGTSRRSPTTPRATSPRSPTRPARRRSTTTRPRASSRR